MRTSRDIVLLLSDVHAQYDIIDAQVAHAEASLDRPVGQVLVLGDFGLFGPDLHDHFRRGRRRFSRPVAFIEGNHEDFRAFDQLVRDYADVFTHLGRGTVHAFGAWRWLCIGGARYMDSWSTPPGCEIAAADIAACLAHPPGSVDVVISHDCPSGIGVDNSPDFAHLGPPGVTGLARVAAQLRPRWWFFGHHHRWHDHEAQGTRFVGLPESWQGYVVIAGDEPPRLVRHEVTRRRRPWWWRLIGLP
jgi:hypothetical protein